MSKRTKRSILCAIVLSFIGYLLYDFFFSSVQDDGKHVVAVIDSGVDYTHEDLKGSVINGVDLIDWDMDPMDENGHGTHVATQILNKTDDTKVLAIRTLDVEGKGGGESILGVLYAIFKKADIVNMSYSETYHPYMPLLIWYGGKRDILFVASTGNDGEDVINYPAKYKGVIPIGAMDDQSSTLYEASNFDEDVQFVAPGVSVKGADIGGSYALRSGTSMATGYASGVMAYLLEQDPTLQRDELLELLTTHAPFVSDVPYQQLEFERFAAINEQDIVYARIQEMPTVTKEETYPLSIETINVERIRGYNELERLLFSTENWEDTVTIPLSREGHQQITLRFYHGNDYKETTFAVIKDTKAPEISYVNTAYDVLSFIITDTTLAHVRINGKNANAYIQPTRRRDYTYIFTKPIEETYPLVIEIEDKMGYKTTKILFE